MDEVRWGIIGCGDVTERKSGPAFRKASGSRLVAVMRRDSSLAADYARRHGVPRWYDDADALIADPGVDAVYIATPPSSHVEYVKRAADAGKPIYCEKPLGTSYAESRDAVAYCEERGVPLFVAYYRRAMEKYRTVAELLHGGRIGRVLQTHFGMTTKAVEPDSMGVLPWRVRKDVSGGGLILDIGSHGLDLLDFLFGPIREVLGFSSHQGGGYEAEDTVSGAWMFESGVHGTGAWCFCADRNEDRITVIGSAGQLSFSVLDVGGPVEIRSESGNESILFPVPEHVQQPLIQAVTDELLGLAKSPSTGESALRTDWVLERLRA